VQPQQNAGLTDEQKQRYLSRYSRASLVLVYFLALFVLIGSLLASTSVNIIQWNWATRVSLIFLVISGFSWVVHVVAVFELARSKKYSVDANRLRVISGVIFYPCLLIGVVCLIVAIVI